MNIKYTNKCITLKTLEGIVSGGLGCGKNTPSWYTKVAPYRAWINCVMKQVKKGNSKEKVELVRKVGPNIHILFSFLFFLGMQG